MDSVLQVLGRFQYEKRNWTYAKALTIFIWLLSVLLELRRSHTNFCDEGVCRFIDCRFLMSFPYLLAGLSILLSVLYLWEKYMPVTILLLAVTGIIVFSVGICDGNRPRLEIVSCVLIAQFFAYAQYGIFSKQFKSSAAPSNIAMFYSIQVVACCYLLSAICKWQLSGLDWVMHSPNVALKVTARFTSRALDYGFPSLIGAGNFIAHFILKHPLLVKIGFALSFLIEFFAFIPMLGRSFARRYAYLLILLHVFIFLALGIIIFPFVLMFVMYMLNLPRRNTVNPALADGISTWRLTAWLYFLALPVLFISSSLHIGEQHPFSKFPMFSTPDSTAHFYTLSGQNGEPVSGYKCFGLRPEQLKNMIDDRAWGRHINPENMERLKEVAAPLLSDLVTSHRATLRSRKINRVNLVGHKLWLKENEICQSDTIIAFVVTDKDF